MSSIVKKNPVVIKRKVPRKKFVKKTIGVKKEKHYENDHQDDNQNESEQSNNRAISSLIHHFNTSSKPPPKPTVQPTVQPTAHPAKPNTPVNSTAQPSKPNTPVNPVAQPSKPNTPVNPAAQSTGIKRALLIGINYFGTENELNGCIKDVQNMQALLTSSYGYKAENITMLTDDKKLKTAFPTKKNITDNIDKLTALTKSGDTLFIHYSGHGTSVTDLNGDEKDNPDTPNMDDAICPCDFDQYDGTLGFIVDDDLKTRLVNKMVKGSKLRVFFDCCHSGSALDLPYMYKSGEDFYNSSTVDAQSDDCLLISGCKDNQTSADAYINNQYSGALTWALTQALNTSVKVKTSWKDLLLVTRHNLVAGQYTQIPMLSCGNKHLIDISVDL